jgi:hypothetical protein
MLTVNKGCIRVRSRYCVIFVAIVTVADLGNPASEERSYDDVCVCVSVCV